MHRGRIYSINLSARSRMDVGTITPRTLSGLQVEDKLEPSGLFHWDVSRHATLENRVNKEAYAATHFDKTRSIANHAARFSKLNKSSREKPVLCRKIDNCSHVADKDRVLLHDDRVNASPSHL